MTPDEARKAAEGLARRSRKEQGLPPTLQDPEVARRVAALLLEKPTAVNLMPHDREKEQDPGIATRSPGSPATTNDPGYGETATRRDRDLARLILQEDAGPETRERPGKKLPPYSRYDLVRLRPPILDDEVQDAIHAGYVPGGRCSRESCDRCGRWS